MADAAHSPTHDPIEYLENVVYLLRAGVRDPNGLLLDRELCRGLVDGLGDALDCYETMVALVEHVRTAFGPPPAPPRTPRTPLERQILARMAPPLDPEGRVVAFPVSLNPQRTQEPTYGQG